MSDLTPMLGLYAIVKESFDVRSDADRRRFVTRVTVEYQARNGDIYRKSFESAPTTYPTIPQAGTSAELNAKKYQF